MYNRQIKGSEAYYLVEDTISAGRAIEAAQSNFEDVVEAACDIINELVNDIVDLESERDDALERIEALEGKKDTFDPVKMVKMMDKLEEVGAAMVNFAVHTRADVEKAYGLAKNNSDNDSGAGSNAGGENVGNETGQDVPADGVTRPQIP